MRTRTCSNPAPQGDGINCGGENTDSQNCRKNMLFGFLLQFNVLVLLLTKFSRLKSVQIKRNSPNDEYLIEGQK